MTVSLLSFCAYLPYIVVSIWAGAFVDHHSKKKIMLICDSIAAAGSLVALLFYLTGTLKVGYLYGINLVIGSMNAFQSPASMVATGLIVPKDKIEKISGMNAFSAGVAASLPIPMISAMQNSVLYEVIPQELQGRAFALRNALQFFTIPIGILLGGYLADYVFEPMMLNAPKFLSYLVGTGKGAGMAVMFLCTGILGSSMSLLCYLSPHVKALEKRKSS